MRRRLGSIRKVGEGKYRVELAHGRDAVTGERLRQSETVYGTDLDAERAIARMALNAGKVKSGRHLTVAEYLLDLYLPRAEAKVRRETARGYRSKLKLHVVPKLGHMKLGELAPYVLDKWCDELHADMGDLAVHNVFRAFSVALNRAVKWDLIQANPLKAVDAPRRPSRDVSTLAADEALAYLQAFAGHSIEPVVVIALGGGLRPCELYALTWADVDTRTGELRVRRGLHERKGETWFEPPKSDRSNRAIVLPEWALDALRPLRGIGPLVHGDAVEGHARPSAVARAYRKHVKASKLRYVPVRDLRHTHATLMLEAGVDVVVVSRRLGHVNVNTTDQFYLRPKLSADQAAAEALSNLLAATRGKSADAASCGNTTGSDD